MKKLFFMLGLCLLAAGAGSCTDDTEKDNARIAELEEQIAALKAQLENNAKITNVAFADGQMTLTFGDGTVLTTDTPDNIVPTIGENGNWWVNGEDLGVSAEAQIPTVGSNGNWWVGGEDTGVSAKGDKGDQGDKGDKGDKGDTGTGIQSTSYDPETGILTITLTDGTKYEYALSTDGEELIGNRLEDLNGAYLLASILNGDLPFAQLTYDDQNRMTSIAYYETLLNAPVKSADVKFTYNADGKIATRTATYYAKQNQVTDIESTAIYNPSSGYGIPGWLYNEAQTLSATQIFDKLFPNDDIYDQIGGSHEFANHEYEAGDRKELFIEKMVGNTYGEAWFVRGNTLYKVFDNGSAPYYYQFVSLARAEQTARYRVVKSGSDYKVHTSVAPDSFDKDDTDYGDDGDAVSPDTRGMSAYDLAQMTVRSDAYQDEAGETHYVDFTIDMYEEWIEGIEVPGYSYSYPAKPYTAGAAVDEISGNRVNDYALTEASETYDATGGNGSYKFLIRRMTTYAQGDAMGSVSVKYVYSGDDYQMNGTDGDGENYDLCFITMKNGRMDKLQVFEDGEKTDLLQFNYNADGKIETIDVPYEQAQGVARFVYDSKKNPTELQVSASKLGKKDEQYDDIFCELGLAYRYTEYDKTLGCLVSKIAYAPDNTTLAKFGYDYALKNFMNHTFTAFSPLMEAANPTNALNEVAWAGHGSCLMTSFSDFNEGGYPTTMKGILSLGDFRTGESEDGYYDQNGYWQETPGSDSGYTLPVNGSVATLYKFTYTKKK